MSAARCFIWQAVIRGGFRATWCQAMAIRYRVTNFKPGHSSFGCFHALSNPFSQSDADSEFYLGGPEGLERGWHGACGDDGGIRAGNGGISVRQHGRHKRARS